MQGYYYYDIRDAADLFLDGLSNFLNWNAFANRFLEVVKEARNIQNSLVITPHAAMVISLVCCVNAPRAGSQLHALGVDLVLSW
tara:strand:- start:258 stop:509 length:252 start_codon:yes stop_codon:yes gene_type:complete